MNEYIEIFNQYFFLKSLIEKQPEVLQVISNIKDTNI